MEEPFLRYNPARNELAPFIERYVSFSIERRGTTARQFLSDTRETLRNQGFNVDASAESVVACTIVEISRGITLEAVEPFVHCEPEYRSKVNRGRESMHVFPEEQCATELEQQIPTLGETENQQRMLAPELVVAMGDPDKVRVHPGRGLRADLRGCVLRCRDGAGNHRAVAAPGGEQRGACRSARAASCASSPRPS